MNNYFFKKKFHLWCRCFFRCWFCWRFITFVLNGVPKKGYPIIPVINYLLYWLTHRPPTSPRCIWSPSAEGSILGQSPPPREGSFKDTELMIFRKWESIHHLHFWRQFDDLLFLQQETVFAVQSEVVLNVVGLLHSANAQPRVKRLRVRTSSLL